MRSAIRCRARAQYTPLRGYIWLSMSLMISSRLTEAGSDFHEFAVAGNKDAGGETIDAEFVAEGVAAQDDRVIDGLFGAVFHIEARRLRVGLDDLLSAFIHGDADDGESLGAVFFLEFD